MGKVRRLIAVAREKEFMLTYAATFVAILSVTSAILSLAGIQFQIGIALIIVCAILLAALAFHYRHLAAPQVSVDDVLSADNPDALLTHLHCPCDHFLSDAAKELASQCYGAGVTIAPDLYEQLRAKNPYILGCLTDRRGRFLGYFDAIPLKAPFANAFLRGLVTEAQVTHEDVLAPQEMHSCEYLFISGLAVQSPNSHVGRRNASILVWALLRYLAHYYRLAEPLAFAVAATKEGDHLLNRFKVQFQSQQNRRADKYRLYSLRLTGQEINKRAGYLPDWRLLCQLDWSNTLRAEPQRGSSRPRPAPAKRRWSTPNGAAGV